MYVGFRGYGFDSGFAVGRPYGAMAWKGRQMMTTYYEHPPQDSYPTAVQFGDSSEAIEWLCTFDGGKWSRDSLITNAEKVAALDGVSVLEHIQGLAQMESDRAHSEAYWAAGYGRVSK